MKELYKLLKEKIPKLSRIVVMTLTLIICITIYLILSFRCEYSQKEGIKCGSEPQKLKSIKP
jgi:hypothetical protein